MDVDFTSLDEEILTFKQLIRQVLTPSAPHRFHRILLQEQVRKISWILEEIAQKARAVDLGE